MADNSGDTKIPNTGTNDPEASAQPLLQLVRHLRSPAGCPWDRAQTHSSLRPYLLEEAHEAAEALDSGEAHRLREELGDLLLQIALHAVIAEEHNQFDWQDIVEGITAKLVRRHPHVFGQAEADTPADVARLWQEAKQAEQAEQAAQQAKPAAKQADAGQATAATAATVAAVGGESALAGIPVGLPALQRAWQTGVRAARVGFEWPDAAAVWDTLESELAELKVEMAADRAEAAAEELGDVLFTLCNLARFLDTEPEGALGRAIAKFNRRFSHMEDSARQRGERLDELTLSQMDELWHQAKAELESGGQ